eukprot:TRINITY_DN25272_c0_g1_i1.p1 TRINITY_DN25272_c0_g1~~TRINITY_DN25272_c0_g1_i1.p1  ORF type:complete len:432 (+),score=79.53 TRINITY_DN25272_c0_g1_i1:58-1353(+)
MPKIIPKKRIVVLGSGWAGFNFLKRVDTKKYTVVCVSPANHFLFTPLLPSCAVGTLEFRAIQEPVRTIKNIEYYQAKAVEFKDHAVECRDIFKETYFSVPYDYLIVACGSKTNTFNTPGVDESEGRTVLFLKHLYHARQIRNRTLECFERAAIPCTSEAEKRRLLSFLVVGGGPTSCEFVGELHDFIQEDCARWYPDLKNYTSVTLVEAGPKLLGSFNDKLAKYVSKGFKNRKIDVITGVSVKEVTENGSKAILSDGSYLRFGMMVWSAGLQPIKLVGKTDFLPKGPTGRILTDEYLNVKGKEGKIFGLGDCAVIESQPLPPIAQAALQEAKYLAKGFNAAPPNQPPKFPKPFTYSSLGSMAMLGGWRAVADFSHVGSPSSPQDFGAITGRTAFLLWRTAYWGRQVSLINKILIPMYWFKAWLFGRDISRF